MNRSKPLHARTPLTRSTPLTSTTALQPGSGLQRRTPLQATGPITASTAPKVKVPAPRAAPGHMRAAVAMVLAGERTVQDAAREFSVDPDRLTDQAARAFREACMERDHYQCQHCGAPATEVQHRLARGSGGTSDPVIAFGRANGVSLCGDSHRLAETRNEGMHDLGFWLWSTEDPAEVPIYVATEYGLQRTWLLPDGTATLDDPREERAA